MSTPVVYPSSLPCPAELQLRPAERRLMSGMEQRAPVSARALQLDYKATAQVSLVLTATEYAAFYTWWKTDLIFGASWFAAPLWPFPWGLGCVARFMGEPTVRHLQRGLRAVQATVEVRGSSLDPVVNAASIYVMLLNFGSDPVTCEITGQTFSLTAPAALEAGMFGQCLDVGGTDPGGGGLGVCFNTSTDTAGWQLNDGSDYQVELFFQMNSAPNATAKSLLKIGPNPNTNFVNYYLQVDNASTPGQMRVVATAPGVGSFPRQVIGRQWAYDTDVHHVVWTGVAGVQYCGVDGVVGVPGGITYTNNRAATQVWRIGNDASGSSLGFNGRIDSIRVSRTITYDLSAGTYTVPTGPLTA